jgi:hypothetical protein
VILDTASEFDTFRFMRQRIVVLAWLGFFLLVGTAPAMAADGESVFLPGWFAWLMVLLAVVLPVALILYLQRRGRL